MKKRLIQYIPIIISIFIIELMNYKKSGTINIIDLNIFFPLILMSFLIFLTKKFNIGLGIRIIIMILMFFAYFSVIGILDKSTVDWTSYIIYLVISTFFGVIYGLLSFWPVKHK